MSRFIDKMMASANAGDAGRGMVTGEPNQPVRRTWAQVHDHACRIAGALIRDGLNPGAAVAMLAGAPSDVAPTAQAVWLCGASLSMLHQPTPRSDLQAWGEDTLKALRTIESDLVVLGEPFEALAPVLDEHGIRYRMIGGLDGEPIREPVDSGEDQLALLQLTSGSTGDPKAVVITHGNLISNITAMAERTEVNVDTDVMVSWLPLFHDMGMVGFLTAPMTFGVELVKVTPMDFLTRPLLWAELITKYRGTITSGPNFAYPIMGRRLAAVEDDGAFDLSGMRIMMSGAEPIDPAAIAIFTSAAARFGLDPRSIAAAYGMAESTVAVSFEINQGLQTDVVRACELEEHDSAVPAAEDPSHSDRVRMLARLGRPVAGVHARVVGHQGAVLPDRAVGEIQLRGEGVSPGYLAVDGHVDSRDSDGWLATGDIGYLVDHQIVICGRRKDVIIMGGRNIYPTDVERAASGVDGVRGHSVAAVRIDPGTKQERFAVVLESQLADDEDAEKALALEVTARVAAAVDARPSSVVVVPLGSLPKTTSGKLRRSAASTLFNRQTDRPEKAR